ncbi:MAG: J domain-containing protein [Clostridia bacterium]|nr:J domain-containing protein [Clostridia bacterium]MBQ7038533.1 J domain-containing protein [Clostridia bacterium]
MQNPYEVLGIQPTATDDEVKAAYRELAKKYHPDNYENNPLSDLAEEKMQEINEAYDAIIRMRRQGGSAKGQSGHHTGGTSRYTDIRNLIRTGRTIDAEALLDGIPAPSRDAEWYFLKGSVLYKKGWLEEAYSHISTAARMDPTNAEYQQAMNRLEMQRRTGGYRVSPMSQGGCSACDVCNGLICADCCCECMGGDLIRCC